RLSGKMVIILRQRLNRISVPIELEAIKQRLIYFKVNHHTVFVFIDSRCSSHDFELMIIVQLVVKFMFPQNDGPYRILVGKIDRLVFIVWEIPALILTGCQRQEG